MKRNIAKYIVGIVCLLCCSSTVGWGQYTINQNSKGNRNTVHTRTQTIYVDKSRTLYIPEMRINDASSPNNRDYAWYVHWYGSSNIAGANVTINANEAKNRGGIVQGGTYKTDLRKCKDGLWWYEGFGTGNTSNPTDNLNQDKNDDGYFLHLATCAAAIKYTAPNNLIEEVLNCDVSNYRDYTINTSNNTFTEPTLLKRYKYIIKPAKVCADALQKGPLETYTIDFPKGSKTVNFSMLSVPENYFWHNGNALAQGAIFCYAIGNENGPYNDFDHDQVQQVDLSKYNNAVTIYVKAKNSNGNLLSNVLATYTFNPREGTGFLLEGKVTNSRKPENYPNLYEEIAYVDFDNSNTVSELTVDNNISDAPLGQNQTVYGFMYKNVNSSRDYCTSAQNQYGLYRSANKNEISYSYQWGDIKAPWYTFDGIQKRYLWIPLTDNRSFYEQKQLYDRTYEKTKNSSSQKYGYFYYIDASDDPGTLVDVPINGILCGYTELTVTAWLSDMTRSGKSDNGTGNFPLPPNINLILKGKKNGEDVILHQFTSGNALTNYKSEKNKYLMQWQQLCYTVVLNSDKIADCTDFHLEVQNNEPHTDGADYAIDDVRIYKSLPNISVGRQDACTASTLLVSSDYDALLRNMGWSEQPNVLEGVEGYDVYKKYRYGLNGNDPTSSYRSTDVGNVFLGFADEFATNTGTSLDDWVTVDEELWHRNTDVWKNLAKYLRVAVPTNNTSFATTIPQSREAAEEVEVLLNVRALNDFIYDQSSYSGFDFNTLATKLDMLCTRTGNVISDIKSDAILNGTNGLDQVYEEALKLMYEKLEIPRISCPWWNTTTKTLYLAAIDVYNTDLKFKGETVGNGTASGEYEVILWGVGPDKVTSNALKFQDNACLLHSPFVVKPSITITVTPTSEYNQTNCSGNIRTFEAQLWVEKEDGSFVDFASVYSSGYTFDWFLGSEEDYNKINPDGYSSLHALIIAYRNSKSNSTAPLSASEIQGSSLSETNKKLLIGLLGDGETEPLLVTGKEVSLRWVQYIMAMPYAPDHQSEDGEKNYSFCTKPQQLVLDGEWDVPELAVGFPEIEYPNLINDVPLRLGLRHIAEGETLSDIPIQNGINFGVAGNDEGSLGILPSNKNVLLRQSNNVYQVVGTLESLSAKKNFRDNKLTVKFDTTSGLFEEGKVYSLYVPFGEYDSSGNLIEDACEGYAVLQIKIVPEFLTWQKGCGDVWYNDSNWKQSTESELYKGNKGNVDANGSDNVANAFAPLYFTKITIPGSQTLELENPEKKEDGLTLNISTDSNIQYEMAVDTNTVQKGYKISPYYINKVSEIYFKPNAQLRHQQYLIYDTARVDFEMAKDAKYWMASPLQDVFAGDMYAPKGTARQETYAFDPIFYSESAPNSGNDRQNPAFYQKAWDKGITMYTNTEGSTSTSYSVVNSNWSIEYNDVNVPYALGKGFYASVEEFTNDEGKALVRLPKADDGYKYEELKSTKALSTIDKRPNTGKLAGEDDIIVVLSDSDDKDLWGSTDDYPIADGDGKHFLLGNPYMYPLDIKKFLTENTVLAQKYWTLSADGTLSVGTPDVAFTWTDGTTVSGEIAPMQAFFVELQDSLTGNSSKQVTFKTNMMVEPETKTTLRSTTATHPVLALRAEKNNLQSIAFVTVRDDATNAYESDKDAVVMIDSELTDIPQVYTVAGDRAAGVNAVKSLVNVPLGVYAASDKEEVTLTIEGVSNFIGTLYIYDAVTGKSQALVGDSHTFYVTGSTHGRYFLRSSESPTTNETVQADAISIYSAVPGKVVVSATERLKQVQVFTTSGTLVRSLQPNQSVHTFDLSQGLYLIRAVTDGMVKTEKVLVR
ncbi:MAG: T9SS type A sorting domain-containing protein [Parabacteroides sp.]|nr:T9SS type A sorting domain-containing protein [Parabacteroides sp.]